METNKTFTMIKPDAVANGHIGAILDKITKSGFKIVALKYTALSAAKAGEFYAVHKERPFYSALVEFMSSGPIVAAILEKDNAVEDFRKLIGATDPSKLKKVLSASYLPNQLRPTRFMVQILTRTHRLKATSFSLHSRDSKHRLKA